MWSAPRGAEVPPLTTSKALNNAASKLSSRIHAGVEDSREKLRYLNRAADHAKNVGETEYFLQVYLMLKSDTREVLTNFREMVSSKNHISKEKELELRSLEKDMVEFEKSFEEMSFKSPEHQLSSLLRLVEAKDHAIFRLCNELNAIAGGEVGNKVAPGTEVVVACSKGVSELLNVGRIFRSLDKAVKTVAMSQESSNLAMSLMAKQIEVNGLTTQLSERDAEISSLSEQLYTLSSGANRQQIMARQNERNKILEERVLELEKLTADLTTESGVILRHKAIAVDSVAALRSQLSDARMAYEEVVKKLQPVVEQQVNQTLTDKREIDSIRSDVGAGLARFSVAEEKIRAQASEISQLQEKLRILKDDNQALEKKMAEQDMQTAKQNRMNLVIVAAKLRYEGLYKEINASLHQLEGVRQVERQACENHLQEMKKMDEYIEELRAEIQNLQNQLGDTEQKMKYHLADSRALELALDNLQAEMAELQEIGFTPQKQVEFDKMRFQCDDAYVKMDRMQRQLVAAVYKQQELQQEIYDLQSKLASMP